MEPEMRLKVLSRSAIGRTYGEIADDLGISEYKVSKAVNDAEESAESSTPEDVIINEVVIGGIQSVLNN